MKNLYILLFSVISLSLTAQKKTVNLIDSVLSDLNIERTECLTEFVMEQKISYYESLLFIPKITESEEEGKVIDAYVLIVNNISGKIESKFSEKKCWYSDAVKLENIRMVYQPYVISRRSETIGIFIDYNGSSSVNPYISKELTLFEREGEHINRILIDFPVYRLTGENDGNSTGEYTEQYKLLQPEIDYEMEFYYLEVTDFSIKSEYKDGIEKVTDKSENIDILKFENGEYKSIQE